MKTGILEREKYISPLLIVYLVRYIPVLFSIDATEIIIACGREANAVTKETPEQEISERLDRSMISMPLIDAIAECRRKSSGGLAAKAESQPQVFAVIIDLNLLYSRGLDSARRKALRHIETVLKSVDSGVPGCFIDKVKSRYAHQHLFASLTEEQIIKLICLCQGSLQSDQWPVYKVWLDHDIKPFLDKSVKTIKADAALAAFSASGENICWAVIDSGIDGSHPHFSTHANLKLDAPLKHVDFSGDKVRELPRGQLPADDNGHGTHVAGIVAGENRQPSIFVSRVRDETGDVSYQSWLHKTPVRGVAPQCKLLSLKVLDNKGHGRVSNLIAALGYISKINSHGRWRLIHGVNMSVGYEFDAEWFACGQSPLCVEVNRMVRSGVLVVTAAGNTGYGFSQTRALGARKTGLDLTINDPGNAELAITVGATHREDPHTYGVSYFSSKGPTGDGRLKPDLVAPGERIFSCAAGARQVEFLNKQGVEACDYYEESGTSMAAPHVSGAIAAFLSIRREFIGESERVKKIFLSTSTDLHRERYFQGYGLVDLMRAIQSV